MTNVSKDLVPASWEEKSVKLRCPISTGVHGLPIYERMDLCYVGGPHDQALEGQVRWVAAGPNVDQLIRWRHSNLHLN